jgi:predicted DNA-binding WGR domain protein/DNA polymerase III delta prime subunit
MHHMETSRISFEAFLLTAFDQGDYSTDDAIAFVLPLCRKVLGFHEAGLVAPFESADALFVRERILDMDEALAHAPAVALYRVEALFPRPQSRPFEIVDTIRLRTDAGEGTTQTETTQVQLNEKEPLQHPAYLPGYRSFELSLGQHDPLTDILCLGLILGGMALGQDLYDPDDLQYFARTRTQPSFHHPRIHPAVGRLITEMTELDRNRRSQDLYEVIRRLEHYRDYDPEKQSDLSQIAGWVHKDLKERDAFILNRLRNRLFDTSRRNRLLYYKPNMRLVNLTVSSVPDVLHYQSIRPDLLFTWNGELAEKITGMKEIVLNKYLRFEDHGYLPSSLDKVRVEAQRDVQEYGFSQLKLVIAFLNWHNLKEDPNERIQTPLLLLPVALKKNKKVKEDHYVLKVLDNAAEVNPVLAGQLATLYGIRLPDFIDLDEMSPEQFYQHVKAQIEEANQGIVLHYIDKPRIRLIHSEARQTVSNYRKRLRRMPGRGNSLSSIPYSYDPENYQPLGLALYRQRIEPKPSQLEFLVNPDINRQNRPEDADTGEAGRKRTREGAANTRSESSVREAAGNTDKGVRERELYSPAESESSPYSWDFDVCHMVLGNFHYKKMSLVRDYNTVIDQQMQHYVFDALFNNQPRTFPEHIFNLNRPDDWYHVITADPTQTRAILQSRAGYSYIIQGPPGTGKSQTITNLIADFVARGKSILFVCEKRAALDVVYHRLKQVGLEELCCYIHDSQGDKRDFIRNLRTTYEDFTKNRMDLALMKSRRQALLERMNSQLDLIREFHQTSLLEGKDTGIGARALIERLIALRKELVALRPDEEERLPSYLEWKEAGPGLAELEALMAETGADPVFNAHPFSRLRESLFTSATPHRDLGDALQQALAVLEDADRLLLACRLEPTQVQDPERIRNLVQFSVLLYPLARTGHLALADPDRQEAIELGRQMLHYRQLQEAWQQATGRNADWTDKLDRQDVAPALALATRHEGSFLGMLNGPWRKLKQQLQQRYDFSRHSVKPSYTTVLTLLQAEYAAGGAVEDARHQLEARYQLENIDTAWRSIDLLQSKKGHPELDYLLQHPDGPALVVSLQALHQPLNRLDTLLQRCLQEPPAVSLSVIRDELLTLQLNADGLGEWLPVLRTFSGLPVAVKNTLRHLPLRILQAEAAIVRKALQELYQHNRLFSGIDQSGLEKAVQQLGEGYKALLEVNADTIRAFVRHRFLQQLDLSNKPASQLNEEQKKFKKIYTEGRKILENEFGKSMRYKSIRELSAKESGTVLKDLKPVWLMSPYSVSDSLPLDFDSFDVVIFDEASQITLEEGVPALYRSRQTIIVGDEKQMPPTDFFGSATRDNDPDDLDKTDEETGDEWLSDDADSLLAQGARKLESTLLSWHYRSHYETLISYSNHAFYEGELLTIPDKTIHHREKAPIRVTRPDDAAANTDFLFDRSISYHLLTDSVYDKRSNSAEAGYIARLVKELLNRGARESIGIVAFSQEQQHAIEDALDEMAATDADFSQQLEEAYNRTENDQFTGLIVKNLENIQGDERDIIIMSVCYGFDSQRRMLMNFGPVNKRGGEKRLNVLFSRARMHMAVVASIRWQHITNEYNEGANYLRRWLQYAELISEGRMSAARVILDGLTPRKQGGATIAPTIMREEIRDQLVARGYEVAEQVGQSGFKCSLAVKRTPEDEQYALAILIDDDRHYRNDNLIEQYYQRPAILKSFGWRVLSVYAKDWLHQPQKVIEQVLKALEAGRGGDAGGDSGAGQARSGPDRTGAYDHLAFRRWVLQDAAGEKFWEAATDGNKMIIRQGRTGSRGQASLKTFGDDEKARDEMSRLEEEQKRKGYEPV